MFIGAVSVSAHRQHRSGTGTRVRTDRRPPRFPRRSAMALMVVLLRSTERVADSADLAHQRSAGLVGPAPPLFDLFDPRRVTVPARGGRCVVLSTAGSGAA
jgi:hypothetical protein